MQARYQLNLNRRLRRRHRVLYPRAKQALDRLSLLLDHPRGTRMPSIAIYGDSGMGKTMIMKRFRDEHPPSFNSRTGILTTPVLAMEMTSRPGERRFYAELLTLLGAPQRPHADIAQMEQAALRIMEAIGVQVPVIDEVHNILAGTYRDQAEEQINRLKTLKRAMYGRTDTELMSARMLPSNHRL